MTWISPHRSDLENIHEEHNLGDIMSDAYVYAVENAADFDGVPVDVAVVPSGTVRDTYAKGDITVEQVFNSFSSESGQTECLDIRSSVCI